MLELSSVRVEAPSSDAGAEGDDDASGARLGYLDLGRDDVRLVVDIQDDVLLKSMHATEQELRLALDQLRLKLVRREAVPTKCPTCLETADRGTERVLARLAAPSSDTLRRPAQACRGRPVCSLAFRWESETRSTPCPRIPDSTMAAAANSLPRAGRVCRSARRRPIGGLTPPTDFADQRLVPARSLPCTVSAQITATSRAIMSIDHNG